MVEALAMNERQLPPSIAAGQSDDAVGLMKDKLRRAVLTLLAVPDPDKKFLRVVGPKWVVVRDSAEAYGWTPERVQFSPTPRDVEVYLVVLGWLSWYERQHESDRKRDSLVKILIAWATGAEYWQLARRFACSERTLRRRLDGLAAALLHQFEDAFQKLFLDNCPGCRPNVDSSSYHDDLASDETTAPPRQPQSFIADGAKPSANLAIPEVSAARTELIERIERGNRRRQRADRKIRRRGESPADPSKSVR